MKFEIFSNSSNQAKKSSGAIKKAALVGAALIAGAATSGCKDKNPLVKPQSRVEMVSSDNLTNVPSAPVAKVETSPVVIEPPVLPKLEIEAEILPAKYDTAYRAQMAQLIDEHLKQFPSAERRAEEKRIIDKTLARALKKVWVNLFAGNMNGERAYFKALLSDPEYRAKVKKIIDKYATEFPNIPKSFIYGIGGAEGGGRTNIESTAGAMGFMQATPEAAIEAGLLPRSSIFDKDDKGQYTVLNPEKRAQVAARLRTDLDFNIHVGVAFLNYLYERYNHDLGLAAAVYCTGPGNFEEHVVAFYNEKLRLEYEKRRLEFKRSGRRQGAPPLPAYIKREAIAKVGWSTWLRDNKISSASFLVDGNQYFPTDTYPLLVMIISPIVEQILTSPSAQVDLKQLVTAEASTKFMAEKQKELAAKERVKREKEEKKAARKAQKVARRENR